MTTVHTGFFFAGKAKDRLNKLVEAYDLFTSYGLKCDFFITHVSPKEQIRREKRICDCISKKICTTHDLFKTSKDDNVLKLAENIHY